MLSNDFWYGFAIGAGGAFLIFAAVTLILRARARYRTGH
jgi:hypothetical protein